MALYKPIDTSPRCLAVEPERQLLSAPSNTPELPHRPQDQSIRFRHPLRRGGLPAKRNPRSAKLSVPFCGV